jgi:GDP/UDP-N,N'-diacetylbacillosamine 2-epimerase (hydrolysing)
MRKIAILTGTRAEYSLLRHIIKKINDDKVLDLRLIVTGTHLSQKYGCTIEDIIKDNIPIYRQIPILLEDDKNNMAIEMSTLIKELSTLFEEIKPDLLLVLGDRYETFAAAITAMTYSIPIAHISGGEITEGAIDEQIRHAITKLSHIHFPGAASYAENILQMGEEDWRIFEFGDPGIENIKNTYFLTREELEKSLGVKLESQLVLVTYHPVTLEIEHLPYQIAELLKALDDVQMQMIITYPNADNGGDYIIRCLKEFADKRHNVCLVPNLGVQRYLSLMKLCSAVVGNSSSALVEAPYLKIPVVNIGSRQKGRLMANNIISCSNESTDIVNALKKAISPGFKQHVLENTVSLYGDGDTSTKIVEVLGTLSLNERLLKKKLKWSGK